MKVFVTGATGYVGGAVVDALLEGGHEVTGLTSSDDKVAALEARGVRPVVGGLGDPGSWRGAAARAEALVHAAFDYGADDPVEADGLAVDTLLSAAGEGTGPRALAYTSGVFHAVDRAPMPMVDVARAASEAAGAGGETRSVPLEEAREELGPVADALCLDQVVAARRSAEVLGWSPRFPSFRDGAETAYREWRQAE